MARARRFAAALAVGFSLFTQAAVAQLDDHLWIGGTGNQLWQVNANWDLVGDDTDEFPNDPGRVDPSPSIITNSEGANLSVNLAANLNVDVGATDITVASLTIGSASGAVATNVTSTGGRLVFENFESNDTAPEPDICAFNCSRALITSQGVAGATNTITALVGLNDHLDVVGTNNITLAGGIQEMSNVDGTRAASLRAITPGLTVFVTGPVTTLSIDTSPNEGTQDTLVAFNSGPDNADVDLSSQGTLDISGAISGAGIVQFGTQQQGAAIPFGRVIVRGNNTGHTGLNIVSRGNLVLGHDNALGSGAIRQDGPSAIGMTGYNIESTDDSRTIANEVRLTNWQSIKGEHSINFSGLTFQTNTAGWINMMPTSETLTLSGPQYVFSMSDADDTIHRIYTFDGAGKTVVTGGIHSRWDEDTETEVIEAAYPASIAKAGSGAVYINGNNDGVSGTLDSNFNRSVIVEGGNIHFATNGDFGGAAFFTSNAGAVGVTSGVIGNTTFLDKLNSSANPVADTAGNLDVYDRGGLMLASGEYDDNLDFSAALINASNMSLAAHESGSACLNCNTYTGVITPRDPDAAGPLLATYRFGGGSGTLTLPGTGPQAGPYSANQLTGARNVEVTNGGVVIINNTNNYTGSTRIVAKYVDTLEVAANQDTIFFDDGDLIPNTQIYLGTTLTVNSLANGGSVSSIGSSTNAASNLYIQGSTLRYEGAATSTNRLFTIGTGGAAIDASGTGALNFTNTSPLGVDIAETRTGNVNAFFPVNNRTTIDHIASTEDLHPGMTVSGADIVPGTTITEIASATEIVISQAFGEFAFNDNTPLTFGPAAERKLTLTGSNAGNNTLSPVIANASDGGLVGVTKTGAGKWILTGNNSYGGATNVNAGTLFINGIQTGTGLTTVNSGGTLGGTGTLGGGLTVAAGGHVAPGASIGTLTVAGAMTLDAGSILDFELGAPSSSDLINVNLLNGLTINGGTLNLTNAGGLAAGTYTLIDYAGTLAGTVDNLLFGATPGGFSYDLVDTGSVINLLVSAAAANDADSNGDGSINAADYVVWRKFNGLIGTGTQGTGDANGDTNVNLADYNLWKQTFGTASPGGGGGPSPVPEPASAVLIACTLAGLCIAARRGR